MQFLHHLIILELSFEWRTDESYTQAETVIYETKDLAKIRSKYHNCPLVYASATPKVETMYQAQNNQIKLLELPKRAVIDLMQK